MLGLHTEVAGTGIYEMALNRILSYGMEFGLPTPDSGLGKGFSIYFESLGFWHNDKGLWDLYKKSQVAWADAAAGIIGSVAYPSNLWERYGQPIVMSALASYVVDDFFNHLDGPG